MLAFVVVARGVAAGSTVSTGSTGAAGSASAAGCPGATGSSGSTGFTGSTLSAWSTGSTGSITMSWSISTPLSQAEFSEGSTSRPSDRRSRVQVLRLKVFGCPVLTDPINPCVISGDCLTYFNSTV